MTAVVFNMVDTFRKSMHNGNATNIHLSSSLKMMIVDSTFTFTSSNQNTDEFITVVGASEVVGTGYTAGGNSCLNGSVTMDTAGLVTVDCNDPATWTQNALGFSNGNRAILYNDTGIASTSRIIGVSNAFASNQGNVAGNFSVAINVAGIYTSAR